MIEGVLLDVSGVLYEGAQSVPGAPAALARLQAAGLPVRLLTNTTTKPCHAVAEKLQDLGFEVAEDAVLTPATVAMAWLTETGHRPHLLIHPDLREDFRTAPDTGQTAVVVGDAGEYFTYNNLNKAFRLLIEGAPLVALAENRMFRDEDGGLSLDAGAFVRALEFAAGLEARLVGKPAAAFFSAGAAALGCAPESVAMVGDDAEADVAGALASGIGAGILVRTGKYRAGDETLFDPAPTCVASDICEAVDLIIARAGH